MNTDIEEVLANLGIQVVDSSGHEMRAKCPGHMANLGKEDHNPSWFINSETGLHNCFSCGYHGNLVSLVVFKLGLRTSWGEWDWEAGYRWLEEFDGLTPAAILETLQVREYVGPSQLRTLSDALLAVYTDPPEWARKARQITENACSYFGVRWKEDTDSWITPIREPWTGKLLGWQEKSQTERRFKNYPSGVKKRHTLFGYGIQASRRVLVESPLDCVRLYSCGVSGGVSTYGVDTTPEQLQLLRKCDSLIIALDNDDAGRSQTKKLVDMYDHLPLDTRVFNYGDSSAKDIGDMSKEEIERGIKTAKHLVWAGL